MIWLALADLGIQKRSMLALLPTMVVLMVVLGIAMGPQAANGIPLVLIVMSAWGYVLRAAYEDDRVEMWTFLRALPIPPAQIVGARFISTALVVLAFGVLVALPLLYFAPAGQAAWPVAAATAVGVGLTVGALFNAFYYRFGYRAAATWFRYLFFLLFLPAAVPWARLKGNTFAGRLVAATAGAAAWLEAHPAGAVAVAGCSVLMVCLASWAYASRAFARKELA